MEDLLSLWERIDLHEATLEERIDAACRAGESTDPRLLSRVKSLLKDEEGEVRYYALQAAVIDLKDKSQEIVDACWKLIESDPDDDVRAMAATCLGNIFFNSRDLQLFRRARLLLQSCELSGIVKGDLYGFLFKIAGRPPREWPGLLAPRRIFEEKDIDWVKVAQLENDLTEAPPE